MLSSSDVVAVVVSHNRPRELLLVIDALLRQSRRLGRIIVIDNASALPVSETLGCVSGVEVIRDEVNSGGAGGFARGLKVAASQGSNWVWLMDDDAVPRDNALEVLLEMASVLPEDAGALCSAVYEFGALACMHRRRYERILGLERSVRQSDYQMTCCEIDTGSFVGFMVRSKAVESVGLPDANFFLAYDDTEYSLRLKSSGWSLWLVPGSAIEHLRSAGSRLRGSPFGAKHFYNIRNRVWVARCYSRLGVAAAVGIGGLIWILAKGSLRRASFGLFLRALRDGWNGRLGKVDF